MTCPIFTFDDLQSSIALIDACAPCYKGTMSEWKNAFGKGRVNALFIISTKTFGALDKNDTWEYNSITEFIRG